MGWVIKSGITWSETSKFNDMYICERWSMRSHDYELMCVVSYRVSMSIPHFQFGTNCCGGCGVKQGRGGAVLPRAELAESYHPIGLNVKMADFILK